MTITIRAADALDSYPALRTTISELEITPFIRVEYCACGVYVRQLAGDSIQDTVRDHNAGHAHQTWRESSPGPTATPGAVDVSNVPAVRPAGGRR